MWASIRSCSHCGTLSLRRSDDQARPTRLTARRSAGLPNSRRPLLLSHPISDGLPDLMRRVFLDEVNALDSPLGYVRPRADRRQERVAGQDCAGLNFEKQLGKVACRKPAGIGRDRLVNFGRLALDRYLSGPGQRRAAIFTGRGADRRPTLTWPRPIPVEGEAAEVPE